MLTVTTTNTLRVVVPATTNTAYSIPRNNKGYSNKHLPLKDKDKYLSSFIQKKLSSQVLAHLTLPTKKIDT